jgi:hypothetical protein
MPDFVRMPDGSLVLTGNRPVVMPTTRMDRAKAAVSGILSRFRPQPPAPPKWWIPQPLPPSASPVTAAPAPQGPALKVNPFAEVEAESARQEALAAELGPFATKVMNSPQLIEGKWFSGKVPQ